MGTGRRETEGGIWVVFYWGYYGTQYRIRLRLYPPFGYSIILLGSTTKKHYSYGLTFDHRGFARFSSFA